MGNIHKNIIGLIAITLFLMLGCTKQEEVEQTVKPPMKAEIVKDMLSVEEINQLNIIAEDTNTLPAIVKLAKIYSDSPNDYNIDEIRSFISDYNAEKSMIEEEEELSDEIENIAFEYNIDTLSRFNQIIHKSPFIINILSLSDSVEIASIEVNRGNCEAISIKDAQILKYGDALPFWLMCEPWRVREVNVHLTDGRTYLMTPNN